MKLSRVNVKRATAAGLWPPRSLQDLKQFTPFPVEVRDLPEAEVKQVIAVGDRRKKDGQINRRLSPEQYALYKRSRAQANEDQTVSGSQFRRTGRTIHGTWPGGPNSRDTDAN